MLKQRKLGLSASWQLLPRLEDLCKSRDCSRVSWLTFKQKEKVDLSELLQDLIRSHVSHSDD